MDNYLLGLVRALARVDRESSYRVLVNLEDRRTLEGLPANFEVLARSLRARSARLLFQQLTLPLAARLADVDVVHSPSFITPLWHGRPRHLLTIHDMTSFSHPDVHTRLRRSRAYRHAVTRSARRADCVTVPSRFVAEQVRRWIPSLTPGRIHVARPGIGPEFRPHAASAVQPVLERLSIHSPYILFVGTIEPRKNLVGLLDAYEALVDRRAVSEQLVIAGRLGWDYQPVLSRISAARHRDRIRRLDYIDEPDLPALYAGAGAFVYPSLTEGFGFPPLEAMATGVPAVASNCSSLRENLGGAAELTPPGDVGALSRALERVLTDHGRREALIAAGLERAAGFSWDRMAQQTLACYRALATAGA